MQAYGQCDTAPVYLSGVDVNTVQAQWRLLRDLEHPGTAHGCHVFSGAQGSAHERMALSKAAPGLSFAIAMALHRSFNGPICLVRGPGFGALITQNMWGPEAGFYSVRLVVPLQDRSA